MKKMSMILVAAIGLSVAMSSAASAAGWQWMSCVNNSGTFYCGKDKGGGQLDVKAKFSVAGFQGKFFQLVSAHPGALMQCTIMIDGANAKVGGCK